MRQVLGVYSYFLETLDDIGDEVVNGKLQAASAHPAGVRPETAVGQHLLLRRSISHQRPILRDRHEA